MKKEDFIIKAVEKHGDKYDYSLVPAEFLTKNKVEIVCKKHGSFFQTSGNHIHGKCGCPECNQERLKLGNCIRKSIDHYVEKVRKVHGDKYDLSLFEYKTCTTKSTVICSTHGNFQVSLDNLSRGKGCPKCARDKVSAINSKPISYFIEMAEKSHKGFYDYSKVECDNRFEWTTVICPLHGEFKTQLETHARGSGNCPTCISGTRNKWSISKMMLDEEYWRSRECYLYLINIEHDGNTFQKIGISSDLNKRFKLIESELIGCSINIVRLHLSEYITSLELERSFKKIYKSCKYTHHEKFGGYTECYCFTDEQIKEVESFFIQVAS